VALTVSDGFKFGIGCLAAVGFVVGVGSLISSIVSSESQRRSTEQSGATTRSTVPLTVAEPLVREACKKAVLSSLRKGESGYFGRWVKVEPVRDSLFIASTAMDLRTNETTREVQVFCNAVVQDSRAEITAVDIRR